MQQVEAMVRDLVLGVGVLVTRVIRAVMVPSEAVDMRHDSPEPDQRMMVMKAPVGRLLGHLEPEVGLEPTTCALRMRCSTN